MKLSLFIFCSVLVGIASFALASGKEGNHPPILYPPKQADLAKAKTPAAPTLSEPKYFAKISGGSTVLKWSNVETAEQYHVQVSTDPNFKWLLQNEYAIKTTEHSVSGLEAGQHYYWRVAAVKSTNESTFTKSAFAKSMFETK